MKFGLGYLGHKLSLIAKHIRSYLGVIGLLGVGGLIGILWSLARGEVRGYVILRARLTRPPPDNPNEFH